MSVLEQISRPPVHQDRPNADTRPLSRAGWFIIVLFFGALGGWSVLAPLNGAVVAEGLLKVDGNRKTLQHLEGGIVKEIRVTEGDHVQRGEVLLVLEDTQARTELEVLSQQFATLTLTE